MKIGFIGIGNMAEAAIRGLILGGYNSSDFLIYDTNHDKMAKLSREFELTMASSGDEVAQRAETLFLVVKPQVLPAVLAGLVPAIRQSNTFVVSIAAGVPLAVFEGYFTPSLPIARVMPNLAAKVCASMSAFCVNSAVTNGQKQTLQNILNTIGDAVELPESQFDVFTAIAGSSPAFTLIYTDALATAGVKCGLSKDIALRSAAQTVVGTVRMLQESGEHPRVLSDQVCSPAGTTIAGVAKLVEDGFEAAVYDAVCASFERSRAFSNKHGANG